MKTILALSLLALAACSSDPKIAPLKTVPHVDLPRFMGGLYVIVTIPWIIEIDNVGTMDVYALRPDGKIDIRYVFHKKSLQAPKQEWKATATVVNAKTNSEWAVQFIWPFKAPYLLIDLSSDYQRTIVGHPSRDLIWIMSRSPQMTETDYAAALDVAKQQGYDTSRITRVPQKPQD
jgi:apolipoprotein D and lipocalin family protein